MSEGPPSRGTPRVFERLAEAYAARPGYPDALVERLSALARTDDGAPGPVVDLGAGTGLLAAPLARAGHPVTAVEPARAMLDACERATAGLPVTPVLAEAEATGLPPGEARLVLLADAVQWVRPEPAGREAARLLASGGVAAVVAPVPLPTPFMEAVRGALVTANARARGRDPLPRARQWLRLAAGPGAPVEEAWEQHVALGDAALEGVVRSLSYGAPALGEAGLEALLGRVREAATTTPGSAVWSRRLVLLWRRSAAADVRRARR